MHAYLVVYPTESLLNGIAVNPERSLHFLLIKSETMKAENPSFTGATEQGSALLKRAGFDGELFLCFVSTRFY